MGLPNERDCAMVMKMLFSDTFCLVTDEGYKLLAQMMYYHTIIQCNATSGPTAG